jgi:hypothetical protein
MWQVTLFVMVLHVNPAEASGLVIWLSHGQIVGRFSARGSGMRLFDTRGRTIGEIDSTLTARRSGAAAIKAPAAP